MKKIWTKIVMILVVIGLMNTLCASVFATESGSITVRTLEKKDTTKPIEGVQVTLYRIANLSDDNLIRYNKTSEFSGFTGDLTWNTASDCEKLATQLYEYAKNVNVQGSTMITGKDGKVVYGNLNKGLYLVVQSGKKLENYTAFIPGLIELPLYEDDEYKYNVTMYPKIYGEQTPKPETPSPKPPSPKPPVPPDPYGMNQWPIPVFAISGCLCLIIGGAVILLTHKKGNK